MATPDHPTGRVVVEFDPAAKPVCGQLVPEGGDPRPFVGWLELTRALETLILEASAESTPADRAAPPAR